MNHTKFNHTPQQKADMYEFLDFFKKNATEETFDMARWRGNEDCKEINVCNTAACVCGWMPPFYKQKEWDIIQYDNSIDFTVLSTSFGIDFYEDEWDYCFAVEWGKTDNTIDGAIARIKYLYEVGLPDNWEDQMNGDAPLSYILNPTSSVKHS